MQQNGTSLFEGSTDHTGKVTFGKVPYGAYAARYLVSIDDLEDMTGLDFLPDLPDFIQNPLESELPSRLWPIRPGDVFNLLRLRYSR